MNHKITNNLNQNSTYWKHYCTNSYSLYFLLFFLIYRCLSKTYISFETTQKCPKFQWMHEGWVACRLSIKYLINYNDITHDKFINMHKHLQTHIQTYAHIYLNINLNRLQLTGCLLFGILFLCFPRRYFMNKIIE